MMSHSYKLKELAKKVHELKDLEILLGDELMILQKKIVGLTESRPTTFIAGKLRDRRIRKAMQALHEGKNALVDLKSEIRLLEMQLKMASE